MHGEGPSPGMQHLEVVDLDKDDRMVAILDDGCNRTRHRSHWAWKAQYGVNKVNQDLGELVKTNVIPKYKGIGSAKGLGGRNVPLCVAP